ncbi:uncharacterized protein [Typha angustifolia]|uniref:uncharacterized protein n=1 Tax=Typha angustifolia TaxID=59011 RepID=UPI003C2E57FA
MADSDQAAPSSPATTSAAAAVAISSPAKKKEDLQPVGENIAELHESQAELLTRIRGLKQDLQGWRSKLDTQVKTYQDELTDLKKTLNAELEQLRLDFGELRTTLQKQQGDVTTSLKSLGMQDIPENTEKSKGDEKEDGEEEARGPSDNGKAKTPSDGSGVESSS